MENVTYWQRLLCEWVCVGVGVCVGVAASKMPQHHFMSITGITVLSADYT